MNKNKKPINRRHVMILIWQTNMCGPSTLLSSMKLRSPKVEGHILSGLAGGDLGYKGSSCFEVEVDLSKHLWRWRYRFTENDDTKFSKWLIMGIGREKESNEPSSGGNTRGIISVFDHTKASHVATMLSLVDQLQNDDHGWY